MSDQEQRTVDAQYEDYKAHHGIEKPSECPVCHNRDFPLMPCASTEICSGCMSDKYEVIAVLLDSIKWHEKNEALLNGTMHALVDCQTELKTVHDAAKRALIRQGICIKGE